VVAVPEECHLELLKEVDHVGLDVARFERNAFEEHSQVIGLHHSCKNKVSGSIIW